MALLGVTQVLILGGQHLVVSKARCIVTLHRPPQLGVELHDLSFEAAAHALSFLRLVPKLLPQSFGHPLSRRQGRESFSSLPGPSRVEPGLR